MEDDLSAEFDAVLDAAFVDRRITDAVSDMTFVPGQDVLDRIRALTAGRAMDLLATRERSIVEMSLGMGVPAEMFSSRADELAGPLAASWTTSSSNIREQITQLREWAMLPRSPWLDLPTRMYSSPAVYDNAVVRLPPMQLMSTTLATDLTWDHLTEVDGASPITSSYPSSVVHTFCRQEWPMPLRVWTDRPWFWWQVDEDAVWVAKKCGFDCPLDAHTPPGIVADWLQDNRPPSSELRLLVRMLMTVHWKLEASDE